MSQLLSPDFNSALPSRWPSFFKWAVIETISLIYRVTAYSRGYATNSTIERLRLKAHLDEPNTKIDLLKEEIKIKNALRNYISYMSVLKHY